MLFFLFFLKSFLLFSQEYSYRHYTVKDGLVQNQVIIMFQDSKGYIWLGTKGGVSRFDGLRFQNYTENDGLLSNYIMKIIEDSEGGINFCSLLGVSRLFDGRISTVLLNDTIQSDNTSVIIPGFTKTDFCVLSSYLVPTYIGAYDSTLIRLLYSMTNLGNVNIKKEEAYNKYWILSS